MLICPACFHSENLRGKSIVAKGAAQDSVTPVMNETMAAAPPNIFLLHIYGNIKVLVLQHIFTKIRKGGQDPPLQCITNNRKSALAGCGQRAFSVRYS